MTKKYLLEYNKVLRVWEVKNRYLNNLVMFRTFWFEKAEAFISDDMIIN